MPNGANGGQAYARMYLAPKPVRPHRLDAKTFTAQQDSAPDKKNKFGWTTASALVSSKVSPRDFESFTNEMLEVRICELQYAIPPLSIAAGVLRRELRRRRIANG